MCKEKTKQVKVFILDVLEDLITIIVLSGMLIYGWCVDNEFFKDSAFLWSGVIAILIIMAIGNLRDRYFTIKKIKDDVVNVNKELQDLRLTSKSTADDFFKADTNEIYEPLLSANSIDILGITLSTSIGKLTEVLKTRLKSKARVRIIILDRKSDTSLPQLVLRSWSKKAKKKKYDSILINTEDLICEIKKEPGINGSLDIGYLPFIPSIGMTLTDANFENGSGIISIYHELEKTNMTFEVSKGNDPRLFQFYSDHYKKLWSECKTDKII